MANTRGVFTLRKILEEKLPLDEWVPLDEVWIDTSIEVSNRFSDNSKSYNTGYFGGGDPPALMDKVTYVSDTTAAVPSANLTVGRWDLAATGNSTHGYFGGGTPESGSTMDKVTYSTDTTAAVPGANLSADRELLAASSSRANGLPQPPAPTPTSQTFSGNPVYV